MKNVFKKINNQTIIILIILIISLILNGYFFYENNEIRQELKNTQDTVYNLEIKVAEGQDKADKLIGEKEVAEKDSEDFALLGAYFINKFDELDNIFIEYDELVADYDELFRKDCYSLNLEATVRSYESVYNRYEDILNDYLLLKDELEEYFGEQEFEYDNTLYVQ